MRYDLLLEPRLQRLTRPAEERQSAEERAAQAVEEAKDVDARVGIRAVVDGDTDAKRAAGALRSAMAAHFELIVQVASTLDEHTRLYAENEAFDVRALDTTCCRRATRSPRRAHRLRVRRW